MYCFKGLWRARILNTNQLLFTLDKRYDLLFQEKFPFLGLHLVALRKALDLLANAVLALLQVQAGLLVLQALSLQLGIVSLAGLWQRIGTNGSMRLRVHLLDLVRSNAGLDEAAKVALVRLLVLLSQLAHVVSNVSAHNVLAQDLAVALIFLLVVSREALGAVRNVQTAIDGSLHGTKDLGSGRGAGQTNVQVSLERAGTVLDAKRRLLQAELGEGTAGAQQTGAISSSIVGQADGHTVVGQLVGVGGSDDDVSLDLGIDQLADDVGVGEADDEAVLGGVVLVLVLDDQTLTSIVVGLALTSAAVLDLEALKVGLVLDFFDERLQKGG